MRDLQGKLLSFGQKITIIAQIRCIRVIFYTLLSKPLSTVKTQLATVDLSKLSTVQGTGFITK